MKALEEINQLIKEQTQIVINSYSKEYMESKWYKEPTLRDVFGETISKDVVRLKKAIEDGEELFPYVKEFEIAASQYGASWYDEDLECERTGYEFETQMYADLRNIVARSEGIGQIDWRDYFEGRGV